MEKPKTDHADQPQPPTIASDSKTVVAASDAAAPHHAAPQIPDRELLLPMGKGSYGEVWLARNVKNLASAEA